MTGTGEQAPRILGGRLVRKINSQEVSRPKPPRAVRFSLTMVALDPGARILIRWLRWVVVLVAAWRVPEVLSWLR